MSLKPGAKLKPGNESRAAICKALLTAGSAGLSCDDLAIIVGLATNGVRWHFRRMPGEVYVAHTHDTRKTRIFHAQHRADGEAYLAACPVGRQRAGGPSEATVQRVLRIIEEAGSAGIGIMALCERAQLARPTLNIVLPMLVRDAGVRMERTRGSGKGRPAHYWAREWQACATETPHASNRIRPTRQAPKKAAVLTVQPIVVPANVKVTICPAGKVHRFTVHNPTPFFAAMTPGSYLRTGSAIERAYGGGD